MAYELIERLNRAGRSDLLHRLQAGIRPSTAARGQKHRVFQPSTDLVELFSGTMIEQKLQYIHANPVSKKWRVADDAVEYPHSSFAFYVRGEDRGAPLTPYQEFGFLEAKGRRGDKTDVKFVGAMGMTSDRGGRTRLRGRRVPSFLGRPCGGLRVVDQRVKKVQRKFQLEVQICQLSYPKVFGLFGDTLTVTIYFVPAVIVMLLQHVSITFASLSIVRETRSGIMELFKVAPITAFEALVGKYLSYLFFEIILAGVITGLAVWLLKIPILGNLLDYALAVVVLIFTSLGVGFLISLISETDTQAVQYSMLLLLASIFFSGFFMDLRLMREPVTVLAWSLPATYGIRMLQDIMLRGSSVPQLVFWGIVSIGIALFLLDWVLLRRKMQS